MSEAKLCIRCNRVLPLTHFHKNKYTKDGHRVYCKDCVAEYGKQYRETAKGVFKGLAGRQRYYRKHRHHRAKPFTITEEWFVPWYENQPKVCHYCGLKEEDIPKINDSSLQKVGRLTVDCKDNDKGYTQDNVVLACGRCNFNKGDFFTYNEWLFIAKRFIKPRWESLLREMKTSTKIEEDTE